MAKRDANGRVIVPKEILNVARIMLTWNTPYFFLNQSGEVGITADVGRAFPSDYRYLGDCEFCKDTCSIYVPENIELAIGSTEYFFTVDRSESIPVLYFHRTNRNKLSSDFISAFSAGFDAWLKEDINQ